MLEYGFCNSSNNLEAVQELVQMAENGYIYFQLCGYLSLIMQEAQLSYFTYQSFSLEKHIKASGKQVLVGVQVCVAKHQIFTLLLHQAEGSILLETSFQPHGLAMICLLINHSFPLMLVGRNSALSMVFVMLFASYSH